MALTQHVIRHGFLTVVAGAFVMMLSADTYAQQPADPNPGNLTLTTLIDFPTTYVFRGIVQESDPTFTLQPAGDVGLALFAGDGGVKNVAVNFGIWNSLQTGSSGSGGTTDKAWYEEDFYTSVTLGFGAGTSLAATYTAYTSPNGMFGTVKEMSFKTSVANRVAPYGLIAFELDGQADSGSNEGTYLELGVGPSWPIRKATFAIPVKVGLSLNDYYESAAGDERFGFFDVGALVTLPLGGISSSFGSWNIHGGVDFLTFGDVTKAINGGDRSKVIGSFGIGLSY